MVYPLGSDILYGLRFGSRSELRYGISTRYLKRRHPFRRPAHLVSSALARWSLGLIPLKHNLLEVFFAQLNHQLRHTQTCSQPSHKAQNP